jgi:hypothetical protein
MFEPRLSEDAQCTGYITLKKMVVENITPFSLTEINRWENNPTVEELWSPPDIRYLRFLHPILRPYIIKNWKIIKTLKII